MGHLGVGSQNLSDRSQTSAVATAEWIIEYSHAWRFSSGKNAGRIPPELTLRRRSFFCGGGMTKVTHDCLLIVVSLNVVKPHRLLMYTVTKFLKQSRNELRASAYTLAINVVLHRQGAIMRLP
jgi:hypothetical protein